MTVPLASPPEKFATLTQPLADGEICQYAFEAGPEKTGPERIADAAAIEGAKSQGISVGFLMVRGISDVPGPLQVFGAKSDRERWKRYAADAAASFTLSMIRNSWPKPP